MLVLIAQADSFPRLRIDGPRDLSRTGRVGSQIGEGGLGEPQPDQGDHAGDEHGQSRRWFLSDEFRTAGDDLAHSQSQAIGERAAGRGLCRHQRLGLRHANGVSAGDALGQTAGSRIGDDEPLFANRTVKMDRHGRWFGAIVEQRPAVKRLSSSTDHGERAASDAKAAPLAKRPID